MKKSVIGLLASLFLSVALFAQNVQVGVNHLYAQRYQSARNAFQQLLSSNPNNIEASYWLGQTALAEKKITEARDIYQKALTASNNAPLLLAGMGQVYLYEGKKAEALQQFEMAINASKGRKGNDPVILNAVGRAIVDAYSNTKEKNGDLDYAISKLNEAAQLAPNNADIFLNLGNAYRAKTGNGGQAVLNYLKAKQINPGLAIAPYRAAMLYKTQVRTQNPEQWGTVLENLNNAVAADPTFAPAYFELYYYYLLAKRDFPTAETYANKYVSNSDPSVENDFIKAQTLWVQNKFNEAITIGKNIISKTNNNANPRLYKLMAYSYLDLKDTTTACDYVTQYFNKVSDDEIVGQDYILHAQSCGKNNPDVVREDIFKAVEADTVVSSKIKTLRDFARDAKANGNRILEAELGKMAYDLEGADANPIRLITDVSVPYYLGGAYWKADTAAMMYAGIAPDSIYGWQWSVRALTAIDTSLEQGLANASLEKVLEIASKDKVRFRTQGVNAAQSLAVYYYNVKNDRETALSYVAKGLDIDPNSEALKDIQKALTPKQNAPKQTTPSKSNTKNSTSSNAAKTGSKPKTKTKG